VAVVADHPDADEGSPTVPADYLLLFSWLFVGIGAALLGGTGLALVHYRRTGTFPGAAAAAQPSPRTAYVKCAIGALLVVWGAASLIARG
jgi:hypothetical protein